MANYTQVDFLKALTANSIPYERAGKDEAFVCRGQDTPHIHVWGDGGGVKTKRGAMNTMINNYVIQVSAVNAMIDELKLSSPMTDTAISVINALRLLSRQAQGKPLVLG